MTSQPASIPGSQTVDSNRRGFAVRRLERPDCRAVAALHREALPQSFMAALGQTFLESFYRTMLVTKATFCFVAAEGDELLGFVCGSTDHQELYREFAKRHGIKLGFLLLPKLLLPSYLRRIRESRQYAVSGDSEQRLPELISLAVNEAARGRGVATALVNILKDEFTCRGVRKFKVMVGGQNQAACHFYEKTGAQLAQELEVHRGVTSRVYTYEMHE